MNYHITTFSNIKETKNSLVFIQGSLQRKKSINSLNLGLGYRKLITTTATPIIVGGNAFIDRKDGTQKVWAIRSSGVYQRYSVGLELKTAKFDVSANIYRPISKNIIQGEKVLQGWDITTKGAFPPHPQLKLGVNVYAFKDVNSNIKNTGNKVLAEYQLNPVVSVRGEYDKPHGKTAHTTVYVGFKVAFDKALSEQLQGTTSSTDNAVWHKRFDKVDRQYDVKTAKVDTKKVNTKKRIGTGILSNQVAGKIHNGDGKSEVTAYALTDGEKYDVLAFVGSLTAGLSADDVTVTATRKSGTEGTDFQFRNNMDTANTDIANVRYNSKIEDKVFADESLVKLTYTATGYYDMVVYVKTQNKNLPSVTITGNSKLSARQWGKKVEPSEYGLPATVTVKGETLTAVYSFEIIESDVGGITRGETTNFDTTTGAIADAKTEDSGEIKVRVIRAEITGKLAQATKVVTIPISKKTSKPEEAVAPKGTIIKTKGLGTQTDPWFMNRRIYKFADMIEATPAMANDITVRIYTTVPYYTTGVTGPSYRVYTNSGLMYVVYGFKSGDTIPFTTGEIRDTTSTGNKVKGIIRVEFTYNPKDKEKYEGKVINVYLVTRH